jgi:hypothetical protein
MVGNFELLCINISLAFNNLRLYYEGIIREVIHNHVITIVD